jgi:hypothetical protein
MEKKANEMVRRSDERAHALVLVRVADLNGELSTETFGEITLRRRSDLEKSWRAFYGLAA